MNSVRKSVLVAFVILVGVNACGKKEDVVIVQVADQKVKKAQFVHRFKSSGVFQKNNTFNKEMIKQYLDEHDVEELLLKAEAHAVHFDQSPEFLSRLEEEKKRLLTRANGPLYKYTLGDRIKVTAEEIKDFYDRTDRQIKIAFIIVSARGLADSLYDMLQQGMDFAELAGRYSIDLTTKKTGGILNRFILPGTLEPTIERVAFSLKLQEVSRPFKTRYGYILVKVIESQKYAKQPLEKMRPLLERRIRSHKVSKFTQAYTDSLYKKYDLRIDPAGARKIVAAFRRCDPGEKYAKILPEYFVPRDLSLPVASYKGGQWTIADFIEDYNHSPILNHIRLDRTADVQNYIRRQILQDVMYQEAKALKLDQTRSFRQELARVKENLLLNQYRQKIAYSNIAIPEERVKAYYEENKQRYGGHEFVEIRDVLLQEMKNSKAREQYNRVIADLRRKYHVKYNEAAIESIVTELNENKKNSG